MFSFLALRDPILGLDFLSSFLCFLSSFSFINAIFCGANKTFFGCFSSNARSLFLKLILFLSFSSESSELIDIGKELFFFCLELCKSSLSVDHSSGLSQLSYFQSATFANTLSTIEGTASFEELLVKSFGTTLILFVWL